MGMTSVDSDPGATVIVRIFFEGFKDLDFHSFAFHRGMPVTEAYKMISAKINVPEEELCLLRVTSDGNGEWSSRAFITEIP